MAASLSSLAPELVLCLVPLLDRPDLSRLSRTCRGLRGLVLEHVYKSIDWEYNIHGRTSPAHLLLRTLSQRPTYGSFVKHIRFKCDNNAPHYEAVLGSPPCLPESCIATIEHHLPQPYKHLPEIWKHQITSGDSGACVAMVLAFLPVLETLSLESFFVDFRCLAGLFATTGSFLKLSRMRLHGRFFQQSACPPDRRFWHWRYFLRLFDLPNLQKASIDYPAMPHGKLPLPVEPPVLRFLTSLWLLRCHSPPPVLEHILGSSPPLKNLGYTYNAPEFELDRIDKQMIDLQSLSRAVARVSTTLKALYLGVNFDATVSQLSLPDLRNGPFQGLTMSLERCKQLRLLHIPVMMLADWHSVGDMSLASKLPQTIIRLDLEDKEMAWKGCHMTPSGLVRMIEELVGEKANGTREAFEYLMIEVCRPSENVGWQQQHVNQLEEICRDGRTRFFFRIPTPWGEVGW